jgi:acyl-CoA reductase-like NAD-dependent aldehyde dehydrogenase
LAQLLREAGLPPGLVTITSEDPGPVHDLIRRQADQVLLTGGLAAGQAILRTCAEAIVPATVELSGLDSFHVLAGADAARAASVLLYGLSLNQGRTCIAPRRIFVHRSVAPEFRKALRDRFLSQRAPASDLAPWVREEVDAALAQGATVLTGAWADGEVMFQYPLILENVPPGSRLWTDDHFSPIGLLTEVESDDEAVRLDQACPLALGAAVFGPDLARASAFAHSLPAPVVTINDAIVPTGDPRLPFGGRRRSGFGSTRGAEGLLDLTIPRVVTRRGAKSWLPHLDAPRPDDEERFQHLLNLLHGRGWWSRLRSFGHLIRGRNPGQSSKTTTTSNPS